MRRGAAVVVAVSAVLTGAAAASAAPQLAKAVPGSANQGLARGQFYSEDRIYTGRLSRCVVAGTQHNPMNSFHLDDTLTLGAGDSTCTRSGGTVITRAANAYGELEYIVDFGGKSSLIMHDYAARCTATATSAVGRIAIGKAELGDRLRLPNDDKELPNPVPKNYTVDVSPGLPPGPNPPDDTIVFNEQVPNGRGGVTVSVAHYHSYFGDDIYFGRADCSPLGK